MSTIAYYAEDLATLACYLIGQGFPVADSLVSFTELALANEADFLASYGTRKPFERVTGPDIMGALARLIGARSLLEWNALGDDGISALCAKTPVVDRFQDGNVSLQFGLFFYNCDLTDQDRSGLGLTSKRAAARIAQTVNCAY